MLVVTKPTNDVEHEELKVIHAINSPWSNMKGDWLNLLLLILLYMMQGIPIGLAAALPLLLQSKKNVSYNDQVNDFY